jgi:hypothetical protein
MPKYKRTSVTAKSGVNFVRSVVENSGSLFHKIEQESDVGIDAIVELVRDERPLGALVAVQIKSGESYCNHRRGECLLPVEGHTEYWQRHPLPVFGIVYVPTLTRAHWVDLKAHFARNHDASVVRFVMSEANRFDKESYKRVFVPTLLRETPDISLDQALRLASSPKQDEQLLALVVLFRRYPNHREVWDEFFRFFSENEPPELQPILIYYLAHIPWHGDIYHFGEKITEETREYAMELLRRFGRSEVVKLLALVDEENMICRGSIGQSVEALVSSVPGVDSILAGVLRDERLSSVQRDCAALILAMHQGKEAIPALRGLAESGSWYAAELVQHIAEYGAPNPYL